MVTQVHHLRVSRAVSIQGDMCAIFIIIVTNFLRLCELVEHVQVLRLKFKYFQILIIKHWKA